MAEPRGRTWDRPVRIGLTGCGTIGRLHARNLAQRGVELKFHNRTPAKAEAFASEFGGEVCAEYAALVAGSDAVVIATPPESHTGQVLAALAAGRPTLVEKPLCATAEELADIQAGAEEAPEGAFVMVAENYYYKPSQVLMREIIAWEGIGAVQSMFVKKLTTQQTVNWKSGYGALLEGGIHFVALVADLADVSLAGCGEPAPVRAPTTVTAEFPTVSGGDPERHCGVILTYEGGLEARLHYAWDVPSLTKGTFQHSRVDGDAGRILFESNGIYVHVRGPGRKGLDFPGFGDLLGYAAMTDDFLRCVVAGESTTYSNLARARRDLDIVFRAYQHLP